MQTFLPYADFARSAAVLDIRRLRKQIVECKQILHALQTGPYQSYSSLTEKWIPLPPGVPYRAERSVTRKTPWYNHPAVKMWKGCEAALCRYALAMCDEYHSRGHTHKLTDYFQVELKRYALAGAKPFSPESQPSWLGRRAFHRSHQSNLKRKDPTYYGKIFLNVPDNLPYIWPIHTPRKNQE